MELPTLARTNYAVRTGAFAYCFLALGLHLTERGAAPAAWVLFALQFLVYPHVVYYRALRSPQPTRAELDNLFIDATLFGAWAAYMGLPTWVTYGLLGSTMLNAAVSRGMHGALISLACSAAGGGFYIALGNFTYTPDTTDVVTALCFGGTLAYTCAIGYVVYRQNRRIARTRKALRASRERYRLIAENVADLVGIVDLDGHWLYTSPSYAEVLEPAQIEIGVDAFARVHPDDAEPLRAAIAKAAATGKARELPLRLMDRTGRVRQYRTRTQPFGGRGDAIERVLLSSHDVTDLRENAEQLLLAAHALEGMTEAIVISAADGTVLTVNQAFCIITGYSRDEVLGQPEKAIRNALQPPEFYDAVYAGLERDGCWSGTQWARRKNGSLYREWRSVRAVRRSDGRTTHYVTVFRELGAAEAAKAAGSSLRP